MKRNRVAIIGAACVAILAVAGCGNEKLLTEPDASLGHKVKIGQRVTSAAVSTTSTAQAAPSMDGLAAAESLPVLDQATQDLRKAEIASRILNWHQQVGHLVVLTQVLDNGQIVDWVDQSTDEGFHGPPPPAPKRPPHPPGVGEVQLKKLSGPPGALPYVRPSYDPYVTGQTPYNNLEDYIRNLPSGHPGEGAVNRLYVSSSKNITNYGVDGQINFGWTSTQPPEHTYDFSIIELQTLCNGTNGQEFDGIGPVVGELPWVYGWIPVFGLERFVGGNQGWVQAGAQYGFHQVDANWAPGLQIVGPFSVIGGAQYENSLGVYYFTAFGSYPNAWWVSFNGVFIGYFSASLFTQLNGSSCSGYFYSEMADASSATTSWTTADLTSGKRPVDSLESDNYQQVGFIRLPRLATAPNTSGFTSPTVSATALAIGDPYCYDGRWSIDGGSYWNPTLWLGGPGGDGPGCNGDPGNRWGFNPNNGAYICSPGCTRCGGSGCGTAGTQPGDLCCGGNITSSGRECMSSFAACKITAADPECLTGVRNAAGTYCCGTGCTGCGGMGCGGWGVGCCTGNITALCSGNMPPCKIDPPPANP